MEYPELQHEGTKLVYFWVKPQVKEKIDRVSKFCRMSKGQILDAIFDGLEDDIIPDNTLNERLKRVMNHD